MSVGADQRAPLGISEETDWAALWRNLVLARARCLDDGSAVDATSSQPTDQWASRARDYDERAGRRWTQPDSTRQFVLSQITDGTLLDIGAGTGAWAAMLASRTTQIGRAHV